MPTKKNAKNKDKNYRLNLCNSPLVTAALAAGAIKRFTPLGVALAEESRTPLGLSRHNFELCRICL